MNKYICLVMYIIPLGYTAALDDPVFQGYADLCNQNLTTLDQLSKELETISSETMYITLCQNDLASIQRNTFFKFTELEKITMSGNPRFQFPADGSPMLTSSSLTDFVCERCGIVKIFNQSLRELPLLEYLVLSSNSIAQIEKRSFRKNRHLKELDLSRNSLRWIPSGLLIGLREIQTLDLSFNRALAPAKDSPFLISNALEILKCNSCGFTSANGNTFFKLTKLKELHLQGNPVFQVQLPVSLSRAIDILMIISANQLRSSVGFQPSADDLEMNLEFDVEKNSDEISTQRKAQTSKPAISVIQYKHR